MKKMLYIARCEQTDEFELLATYDKDAAIKAARYNREHLTRGGRKGYRHWVDGFSVEVNDGESAKECYDRLMDDDSVSLWNGCDEVIKIGGDACFYVEFWDEYERQTAPTLFAAKELADAQAAEHKGGDIIIRDDDGEEVARKCWDDDDGFGEW